MIFAKIDNAKSIVITYPLSTDDIRRIHDNISFPEIIDVNLLSDEYVEILDIHGLSIKKDYITYVAELEPIFNDVHSTWNIDFDIHNASSSEYADTVEKAKFRKILELVKFIDEFSNTFTESYKTPNAEMQTWSMQSDEAVAWSKDKTTLTPILNIIAATRNIDIDVLREKALSKTIAYQIAISFIVGKKQYFEDLIDNAKTIQDVRDITINIALSDIQDIVQEQVT